MRSCHAPTSAEPQPDGVPIAGQILDHGVVGASEAASGRGRLGGDLREGIVVADAIQEVAVVITRC